MTWGTSWLNLQDNFVLVEGCSVFDVFEGWTVPRGHVRCSITPLQGQTVRWQVGTWGSQCLSLMTWMQLVLDIWLKELFPCFQTQTNSNMHEHSVWKWEIFSMQICSLIIQWTTAKLQKYIGKQSWLKKDSLCINRWRLIFTNMRL